MSDCLVTRAMMAASDARGVMKALLWAAQEHDRTMVARMCTGNDWPRDGDQLVWPVPYVRIRFSSATLAFEVEVWSCPCPEHRWSVES